MITEKQMKIVDAVDELMGRGYIPGGHHTHVITPSGGYIGDLPSCTFDFDLDNAQNTSWDNVCTIEEYSHCIEEMKYHYDIPKWCSYHRADKELLTVENSDYSFYEKEKFVYGQDIYVNYGEWKNRLMKFGCFTLDNKKALLFDVDGNGYCRVTVESMSSNPFKSKEDIELEAKDNQLDKIMKRHAAKFCRPEQFKSVIKAMQEGGELAPINLTEEE